MRAAFIGVSASVCLIALVTVAFSTRYDVAVGTSGGLWRLNKWTGEVCWILPKSRRNYKVDAVRNGVERIRKARNQSPKEFGQTLYNELLVLVPNVDEAGAKVLYNANTNVSTSTEAEKAKIYKDVMVVLNEVESGLKVSEDGMMIVSYCG